MFSLCVDAHLLWHMCTSPRICPSKSEIVRPKMTMLEHVSIHHLPLISITGADVCTLVYEVQWTLVYPTTFFPHKMCWINQVLGKPGVG